MPFYDYKCSKCNHIEKDIWELPSDSTKKTHKCPKCKNDMHRLIGNLLGIRFVDLPPGHNLNATQRREAFNSSDPKEFRKIM